MKPLKAKLRSAIEAVTGCHLLRFGARKSFALIDRRRPSDGWFCSPIQLQSILTRERIDLVIDVGANIGQFAGELRTFYTGDIYSFEPVSATFAQLASRAANDARWHPFQLALGRSESELEINVSDSSVFSSFLNTNDYCSDVFGAETKAARKEKVRVCTLESFCRQHIPDFADRRIFLKMDTQGFDLEVFGGLGSVLPRVVALQSEVSLSPIYEQMPHWTETISRYEHAGFAVAGLFPVNSEAGRVIEYDCLMIRPRPGHPAVASARVAVPTVV